MVDARRHRPVPGNPTFVRTHCPAYAFARNGSASAVGHATAAAGDTVSARDCRHADSGPLGQRAVSPAWRRTTGLEIPDLTGYTGAQPAYRRAGGRPASTLLVKEVSEREASRESGSRRGPNWPAPSRRYGTFRVGGRVRSSFIPRGSPVYRAERGASSSEQSPRPPNLIRIMPAQGGGFSAPPVVGALSRGPSSPIPEEQPQCPKPKPHHRPAVRSTSPGPGPTSGFRSARSPCQAANRRSGCMTRPGQGAIRSWDCHACGRRGSATAATSRRSRRPDRPISAARCCAPARARP